MLPTWIVVASLLVGQAESTEKVDGGSKRPAAAANGETLSRAPLAAKVKGLVLQLDSNQQARREAAEAAREVPSGAN